MGHGTETERGAELVGGRLIAAVERYVLLTALGLCAVAGLLWRTPEAVGAVASGGLLAFLNLLILRRTVNGILDGSRGKRAALSVALFMKMGLLLFAIWAAVRLLGFDPIGVGLGVSALMVGIVGGTLAAPLQQPTDRAQPGR